MVIKNELQSMYVLSGKRFKLKCLNCQADIKYSGKHKVQAAITHWEICVALKNRMNTPGQEENYQLFSEISEPV